MTGLAKKCIAVCCSCCCIVVVMLLLSLFVAWFFSLLLFSVVVVVGICDVDGGDGDTLFVIGGDVVSCG